MPLIMPYLDFPADDLPEIGSRLVVDRKAETGRCRERVHVCTHKLIDCEEHTRRDGTAGTLLTWQSDCGECGREFKQVTGASFKGFMRRCPDCRKARPRAWQSFPKGPRHRYTLYRLGEFAPGEVDPATLF